MIKTILAIILLTASTSIVKAGDKRTVTSLEEAPKTRLLLKREMTSIGEDFRNNRKSLPDPTQTNEKQVSAWCKIITSILK